MIDIKTKFEEELQLMTESAGRGRGPQVGVGVKDMFKDAWKSANYSYLNRSTHHIFKEEKYNFNNYYSLDLRINIDKLLKYWESGADKYSTIFETLWDDKYGVALRSKLLQEYERYYKNDVSKVGVSGKVSKMKDPEYYAGLNFNSLKHELSYLYNEINAVSIFIDENGMESITIKQDEFVPLIMNGMASAIRGHVPQGVTIEEILEGKFSRKAIAPEQGTFINRVKDPTSDKEFDFRSWSAETMEELHALIMNTFKRDKSLTRMDKPEDFTTKKPTSEEQSTLLSDAELPTTATDGSKLPYNRETIFLYITQDDFHALEKGGKGFSDKAKDILGQVTNVANRPDV